MAGAGYKLFNTGDVLTAAQVNTYLMEQTVMVFADAAARTTALSGVVSEGMISYLKNTNAVEVYDGSNWVSSDDPNAIQNTIVDAKGDLITATAADTPSRIAVGNNGETLVADSSASTGLRWQGNFAAGKNAIINGDLRINQRNFTSSTSGYNFDRFYNEASGGTHTITPQTFTPGSAPVAGYEATNFMRSVVSGQTTSGQYAAIAQKIEDVRTFAGQTITVSFWAKASTGTPKVSVEMQQAFGSGGSGAVTTSASAASTLSTSWARYTATISIPSISGKTIGTGSSLAMFIWVSAGSSFDARSNAIGLQNATLDFWGFQVEAGNVATAFQTATGTLAGELGLCQRYYWRFGGSDVYERFGTGQFSATTTCNVMVQSPVPLRTAPTSVDSSTLALYDGSSTIAAASVTLASATKFCSIVQITVASGGTINRSAQLMTNNSTSGYLGLSAEL